MAELSVLEQESTFIRFRHHENGVYEFIFLQATQAAVDHFFTMMAAWIEQQEAEGLTHTDTVRLIVDFRVAGTPAMNYVHQCSKNLLQKYPPVLRPRSRCATLLQHSFLIPLANAYNSLLPIRSDDRIRIFSGEKAQDVAIGWVLKDD